MNLHFTKLRNPWLVYLGFVGVCLLVFLNPLSALLRYAQTNDNASHILIIPFLFAGLLYHDRHKLPAVMVPDFRAMLCFAVPAVLLGAFFAPVFAAHSQLNLTVLTLSLFLFLVAGFVGIFGRAAAQREWFALAFLVFTIPPPEALLNWVIYELQVGSSAIAGWIFDLAGVPVLREGFVFHLSGFNIEVARECSGIRSSIALLILAVLIAHFSFRRMWRKVLFIVAGMLVMVVKNGVRIATLTILAKYVDPGFLFGRLHHEGGAVFFLLALALLTPVYWLLRRDDVLESTTHQPEAALRNLPTRSHLTNPAAN